MPCDCRRCAQRYVLQPAATVLPCPVRPVDWRSGTRPDSDPWKRSRRSSRRRCHQDSWRDGDGRGGKHRSRPPPGGGGSAMAFLSLHVAVGIKRLRLGRRFVPVHRARSSPRPRPTPRAGPWSIRARTAGTVTWRWIRRGRTRSAYRSCAWPSPSDRRVRRIVRRRPVRARSRSGLRRASRGRLIRAGRPRRAVPSHKSARRSLSRGSGRSRPPSPWSGRAGSRPRSDRRRASRTS